MASKRTRTPRKSKGATTQPSKATKPTEPRVEVVQIAIGSVSADEFAHMLRRDWTPAACRGRLADTLGFSGPHHPTDEELARIRDIVRTLRNVLAIGGAAAHERVAAAHAALHDVADKQARIAYAHDVLVNVPELLRDVPHHAPANARWYIQRLAAYDRAFGRLGPSELIETLRDVHTTPKGDGSRHGGLARAFAALCVACGAFGAKQNEDAGGAIVEVFDDARDRFYKQVRGALRARPRQQIVSGGPRLA